MTPEPADSLTSPSPSRIGYFLRVYPRLSETFIVNEILALEADGADLSILSIRKPGDGIFHESISRVRARAQYVPEPGPKLRAKTNRFLWNRLRRSPGRMTSAIGHILDHGGLSWRHLRMATYLQRWVHKNRIDHLHIHFGREAAAIARVASDLRPLSYSVTLHAYDIFRNDVDTILLEQIIQKAAFVITVSDFNRRYLLRQYPNVDPAKIIRHYNGVDLDRCRDTSPERDANLVFAAGRLIEKKGLIYLVRAIDHLCRRGLDPRCIIAGEGREAGRLQAEIHRLHLGERITLAGAMKQDEILDLMTRATCFALPCTQATDGNVDALPTVLLEALACGCPAVSTRLSGIPEIIEDRKSGLLVEPEDDAAL
ncbi:MAG: glycosyltransferase, partial [Phycisphaerae bacterium]|nr:glycosyltransferase [Phycisphaerae bacterium]